MTASPAPSGASAPDAPVSEALAPDGLVPDALIEGALAEAVRLHRAGDLAAAEQRYRAILERVPRHADGNHNLGILQVARGQAAAALPHFQAAIAANPARGQYWVSCIDALLRVGQPEAARQMLQQGVASGLRGQAVEALQRQLGQAATGAAHSLEPMGRPNGKAVVDERRRRARRKHERRAPGKKKAAAAPAAQEVAALMEYYRQRRYAEGEALARTLTARFPADGFAWKSLGVMLQQQGGRLKEALEVKLRAAQLLPGDAEMQNNLGNALLKLMRLDEAEAVYRRAIAMQPEFAEPWSSLGVTMQKLGRLQEAERACRHALELRPVFADALSNLGIVLQEQGRFPEAEESYRAALAINPGQEDAWNNLGITLQKLGRLGEAEAAHLRSLELKPGNVDAMSNLAGCLQQQARLEEAELWYRRAIGIDPDQDNLHTNLLFCISHDLRTTPESLFDEHRRFGEFFEAHLRAGWTAHANTRDPDRVLRIGFVSADFRHHAMSHFIEPLLTELAQDRSLLLHTYANHTLEDAVTERLRARIPLWNTVVGLSDERLAAKIRGDAIDILIDLSGHTGGTRIRALARKPAPLQCGWIGYLGTSGLECMDYYLADRYYLPRAEFAQFFTEKILSLLAVAAFRPDESAPAVSSLPAIENGYLTFASFARMGKLNPETIGLWSQLLRALPQARMLLGGLSSDGRHDTLTGWFADQGIDGERLEIHSVLRMEDYLALHREIDLCLDPFPFTGATTTCHALWMGVPTLTLEGRTPPGRLGAAMLRHVGLEGFVARDLDDFLGKGLNWARRLEELAALRAGLRGRFRQSAIGQPSVVARGVSAALREIWREWCQRGA